MKKVSPLNFEQHRLVTLIMFSSYVKSFAKERAKIIWQSNRGDSAQAIAKSLGCDRKKISKAIDDWNTYKISALGLDLRGKSKKDDIPKLKISELSLTQLDFCIEIEEDEKFQQKLRQHRELRLSAINDICIEIATQAIHFISFESCFCKHYNFKINSFRKDFRNLKISFFKSLLRETNQKYYEALLDHSSTETDRIELMLSRDGLENNISIIQGLNKAERKDTKRLVKCFLRKFPANVEGLFPLNMHLQVGYLLERELRDVCEPPKDSFGEKDLHDIGCWALNERNCSTQ